MDKLKSYIQSKKKELQNAVKTQKEDVGRQEATLGRRPEIDSEPAQISAKEVKTTTYNSASIDLESLRKKVLEDPEIKAKLEIKKEIVEPIKWTFSNTPESIAAYVKRHERFISLFKSFQGQIKKFDFGNEIDYRDKCDDIKTFLIYQIDRYETWNTKLKLKPSSEVADLRSDLTLFVDMLQKYVS